MSVFDYRRRTSSVARIGNVEVGGNNPVKIQSMTSTSTMDTEASVTQCAAIADAGADIVRLTAQGTREARNMGVIKSTLRQHGYSIPLVADIHFNPRAAFAAAEEVEKIRINPGNFADPGRTFVKLSYTDEEYASEVDRIRDAFVPLLKVCKEHSTALRIGVNHGSLSDRIMSRYGDTPEGMAESAMEYLRICRDEDFTDVVISIKASNTVVMVETVRRLVAAMDAEDMAFPLHLGVTEAGDGEDGRIKSALGIGALLADGIGDTIRVSLSEDPVNEVPVAQSIVDYISTFADAEPIKGETYPGFNPIRPEKRHTEAIGNIGGDNRPVAIGIDFAENDLKNLEGVEVVTGDAPNASGKALASLHKLETDRPGTPAVVKFSYPDASYDTVSVKAAIDFGRVLLAGFTDGIWLDAPALTPEERARISLSILQAARCRMSKTEYIACPGCGRTLFDLRGTLAAVRQATSHLSHLKIGIMGCIVNGPGEMADADYGYVGASAGHISLYKGKQCVEKNIPQKDAIDHLIALIKENGDWTDPQ